METKGMFGKLKEELAGMVDAETLEKLKNAGTREEALGILEDISGELPDEVLDAVAGGEEVHEHYWEDPDWTDD